MTEDRHDEVPAAAGTDLDTRKRVAKTTLAAALTVGDDEAADQAQKELDAVNSELDKRQQEREAAAKRREALANANGKSARTTPQGRTSTAPRTTSTDAPTGGKQK